MKKKLLVLTTVGITSCFSTIGHAADINNMTFDELKQAYIELEEKYNTLLGESEMEAENVRSDTIFSYSAEGFTYKYLKNEMKTIDGTDFVFVYFEFTNDSGNTTSPYYSLTSRAFQNGVEIESYMSFDEGVPEAETAFKEVKTGTTVDIAFKYELADDSPVSIEISPMFITDGIEIGEFEFELTK